MNENVAEKIERCGYCGVIMINGDVVYPDQWTEEQRKQIENNDYKLGYCPNAQQEHDEL